MNRSMIQALLFPTCRLCRVGISLRSNGTLEELGLLAVHPSCFVSSQVRTSGDIGFRSSSGDASAECRDVGQPSSSHSGVLGGERRALPSSQGTLLCLCPGLRPRSGLHAKPFAACRCCPLSTESEDPGRSVTFRSSISQPGHSLSTLRAALTDDDARLACRCWLFFPVRDLPSRRLRKWYPQGSIRMFQVLSFYVIFNSFLIL